MKKGLYAVAGASLLALNSANAAINFGQDKVSGGIQGSSNTADVTIQNIVGNFMAFLGIIAVLYLLWGGFQILTAAGDDEKVGTGKKIIIQAAIGLIVIFVANSIVQWVLNLITGA